MLLALTGVLALAGLALNGCGGGEESATTSSGEASVAQEQKAAASEAKPQGQKDDGSAANEQDGGGSRAPASPAGTHASPAIHSAPGTPGNPTPGTKAPAPGVPVTSGGDNSVQTFGTEGDESEREQAEASLRSYLNAKAEGNWAAACEVASEQFRQELAKLIESAKGDQKPEGCAETLELLSGKTPATTLSEAAQVSEVLSFRIRDDGYAYLIFESQGKIKFIAMANDNGTWKVNVPEPASFQASQGETQ